MRASIQRFGNSQGVIIPQQLLARTGLTGEIEISVEDDAIVLRKLRASVRRGWADDAKAVAASADDGLVWPEFANADDRDLAW